MPLDPVYFGTRSFGRSNVQLRGIGRTPGFPAGRWRPSGLGVAPIVVGAVAATGAAIGGLLAILQSSLDDDWTDTTVFNSHARDIHRAMLAIQCLLGGAKEGSPLQDMDGNVVCPGGTAPICSVSNGLINEWRSLRDGFGTFWAEVAARWRAPTNAQAQRLKDYAMSFYHFYQKIEPVCRRQGVDVPAVEAPPPDKKPEDNSLVQALKYSAWIVGGVAAVYGLKLLYDVFKK